MSTLSRFKTLLIIILTDCKNSNTPSENNRCTSEGTGETQARIAAAEMTFTAGITPT